MGVIIYLLQNKVSILLLVPLGTIIYFVILIAVRGVTKEDFLTLYHSVFKKQHEENSVNNA